MQEFDWPYEAWWFRLHHRVRKMLQEKYPEIAIRFDREIRQLRAPDSFQEATLKDVLSPDAKASMIEMIDALADTELERHEIMQFGRDVVHNHPRVNALHREFTGLASECAGEPLVASYNFLSLYNNLGVCELHMDAPFSQWTLDVCVRQTHPWPIYVSDPAPWPKIPDGYRTGWQDRIKASTRFRSRAMREGDALFFAGSSQWHYRDRIPKIETRNSCELVFFHFISERCLEIVDPRNWSRLFDCDEIDAVASSLMDLDGIPMVFGQESAAT